MDTIQLSIPHYVFLLTVLSIFIAIGFRRGVIIPALAGTFLIGILSADRTATLLDQLIFGVQVLFKALLNAGTELRRIPTQLPRSNDTPCANGNSLE